MPDFLLNDKQLIMKKALIVLFFLLPHWYGWAKESINPSIAPALFRYNDQITVTYDVTGTPLASLSSAWIWVWIPGKSIDAKYNVNPASADQAKTDNAKFIKTIVDGKTLFTITFTPSAFFEGNISTETKLGILLKGNDWGNGQTTDFIANFWDGSFQIKLTAPTQQPLFVSNGVEISIEAETPLAADYTLFVNDILIDTRNSVMNYTYTYTVTETSGYATVKLVAVNGANSDDISFQYLISTNSAIGPRPTGIIPGINYTSSDHTKVTLCLWAPGKSSVYVRGDFSNWQVLPGNLMTKDGEYFWIEISGLTQGIEYGFQYLIDEVIYTADPYADKILDPDDQFIPPAVYPNLKAFPQEALNDKWYFNRVAVFQTGQAPYTWQVENFEKPAKESLVVYELLVRDFFADGQRSYQNLIDTVNYFERLGITAIELMPIMEFNGNDSWGYNPAFMFAPDKYYGTKNKFKEFVDVCHQHGIAVILDIAMNHHDIPNPYILMDFDFGTLKPTANNKWFNTDARHPFNVFYDMNHESPYTKAYLDTVNYYWLNEYKVDGFRFDLSKGFTQTNNPNNVDAWSAYDASRIAILKRMADKIWTHTPEAYLILEHLAVNTEEKELAEYRAGEGKGMLLWGNLNNAYAQSAMGYAENSDIGWIYHTSRGWTTPHVVGYMESHDEERLMYKNLQFGNAAAAYNVKTLTTALKRIEAASTIFYTIPGPKMLWQFGELGYDYSINHCPDGSNNSDCRVSAKPVAWGYRDDSRRYGLYEHIGDLIRLRKTYDVFTIGTATLAGGNNLVKQLTLKNNPYTDVPANASEMNAVVVVNFDVITKDVSVSFPHTGNWFDYYDGGNPIAVLAPTQSIALQPGGYRLLTDVYLPESPIITAVESEKSLPIYPYPNPSDGLFTIDIIDGRVRDWSVINAQGEEQKCFMDGNTVDIRHLSSGLYILKVTDQRGRESIKKLIKK